MKRIDMNLLSVLLCACSVILPLVALDKVQSRSMDQAGKIHFLADKGAIKSWKILEDEISSYLRGHSKIGQTFTQQLMSWEGAKYIDGHGTPYLWSSMLQCASHPLIQVLGFEIMSKRFPTLTGKFAIVVLSSTSKPSSPSYDVVYEKLRESWGDVSPDDFGKYIQCSLCGESMATDLVIRSMPMGYLAHWVQVEKQHYPINMKVFALAVERFLVKSSEEDAARVDEVLKAFRQIPGTCRVVYLLHLQKLFDDDKQLLIQTLEDPETEKGGFFALLSKYRDKIDLKKIRSRIPQDRVKLLDFALHDKEK